jgi:hypothetical protein
MVAAGEFAVWVVNHLPRAQITPLNRNHRVWDTGKVIGRGHRVFRVQALACQRSSAARSTGKLKLVL